MTRKTKNDSGERIRVAFELDRGREPELDFLFDLTGHGERPRELLRLARIGRRTEIDAMRMAQQAGFSSLAHCLGAGHESTHSTHSTHGSAAPVAPPPIAQPPLGPTKTSVKPKDSGRQGSAQLQSPESRSEVPSDYPSSPDPRPSQPSAQGAPQRGDHQAPSAASLNSFLA